MASASEISEAVSLHSASSTVSWMSSACSSLISSNSTMVVLVGVEKFLEVKLVGFFSVRRSDDQISVRIISVQIQEKITVQVHRSQTAWDLDGEEIVSSYSDR